MRPLILLLAGLVVLPASGAEPATSEVVTATVSLTDGSRLIGQIGGTAAGLELQAEALGKVNIPWLRIRQLDCTAGKINAVLTLQNGDKLRGAVLLDKITLRTLIGPVALPLSTVRECQINARGGAGRVVEWEKLPFFTTSNWPGPQGEEATFDRDEFTLRGHPVRTRGSYALPLVIECELQAERVVAGGAGLHLDLTRPGVTGDKDVTQAVRLSIGYCEQAEQCEQSVIMLERLDETTHGRVVWREALADLKPGRAYRLHLVVSDTEITVGFGEHTYPAQRLSFPYEKTQIELWNWQPGAFWRVRDFSLH
jgi:hypothetical protein